MADIGRQKPSKSTSRSRPKLGANQVLSKSSSGASSSLQNGGESNRTSTTVSSALSLLDKLDLNHLKQTTFKYVNKSTKLQQHVNQQRQIEQEAMDMAARRACIDYALELVISNLIINGQLDPTKAYQMRTPVMKARIGLLCEKILNRRTKNVRSRSSSKKFAPGPTDSSKYKPAQGGSKVPSSSSATTTPVPTAAAAAPQQALRQKASKSKQRSSAVSNSKWSIQSGLPLSAITDSTIAHMQGLGLGPNPLPNGTGFAPSNEKISERIGKKSGVLHFKTEGSQSSLNDDHSSDLHKKKLKKKRSKNVPMSVVSPIDESSSQIQEQQPEPLQQQLQQKLKKKSKSKTVSNAAAPVDAPQQPEARAPPATAVTVAPTPATTAAPMEDSVLVNDPHQETNDIMQKVQEQKQLIYQASSEVPSNFSIEENNAKLSPSQSATEDKGSFKSPRNVQFEQSQDEVNPKSGQNQTILSPDNKPSNDDRAAEEEEEEEDEEEDEEATINAVVAAVVPQVVEKPKPVAEVDAEFMKAMNFDMKAEDNNMFALPPTSAVPEDSRPSTGKTLNSIITNSNSSVTGNSRGYKVVVDMKGFSSEEISMDVDGRQLIFIASRQRKDELSQRKVTEVIDVPVLVKMENLKIGRTRDGFVTIEEHAEVEAELELEE